MRGFLFGTVLGGVLATAIAVAIEAAQPAAMLTPSQWEIVFWVAVAVAILCVILLLGAGAWVLCRPLWRRERLEMFVGNGQSVVGASPARKRPWIRDPQWHWNKRLLPWLPLVTLGEAVDMAWRETQGTNVAAAAEANERDGNGTVKTYYAIALVGSRTRLIDDNPATFKTEHVTHLTVYGRRPPSRWLEVVPAREFAACSFSDDGNSITRYGEKQPRYIDLHVTKSELKNRISEIRQW